MGSSGTLTPKVDVPEVVCEWAETEEAVIEIKNLASAPEKVIVVGEPTDEAEGKLASAVVFFAWGWGDVVEFLLEKLAGPLEMAAEA